MAASSAARQRRRRAAGPSRRPPAAGADKGTAYLERVVTINRVAKVVQGGRRFSFTALVVVGDGNGMVGVGYGKAQEVPAAIAKGVEEAKKSFFRVPRIGGTIPHTVQARGVSRRGAAQARQPRDRRHRRRPGARRARVRGHPATCCSRSLGSSNPINVVHATVAALKSLEPPGGDRGPARPADRGRGARGRAARSRAAAAAARRATADRECVDGTAEGNPDQVEDRRHAGSSGTRCARSGCSGSATWSSRPTGQRFQRHDPGGAPPGHRRGSGLSMAGAGRRHRAGARAGGQACQGLITASARARARPRPGGPR